MIPLFARPQIPSPTANRSHLTLSVLGRGMLLLFILIAATSNSSGEPFKVELAPAARKEAQEQAKLRHAQLHWQIIPDSKDYPTDDVIVAALTVNDPHLRPVLPLKPAQQDCTATVQDAIDQVWANGGGTVFLPAGEYAFNGSLNVRPRVTLRGQWSLPAQSGWKPGTVLKILTPGAKPFVTIEHSASIQGLTFWYPLQNPDAPVPCPPTVQGEGENTIYDVSFVNSWEALSIPHAEMLVLRGVYGTAIHSGLTAEHGVAFPRFDSVRFSPHFWPAWTLGGSRIVADRNKQGSYANHMWQTGTGIRLHEMDGCNLFHCDISGYAEGIVMEDGDGAAQTNDTSPHGQGIRVKVRDCRTALRSRLGGMEWTQCEFSGSEYGIYSTESGGVTLTETRVAGGRRAVQGTSDSKFQIHASQSNFEGSIELQGKNTARLIQCHFNSPAPQITAGKDTKGELQANMSGSVPITVIGGRFTVDTTASHLQPLPPFGLDYLKDWNRLRKPAKTDLFSVRDPRFAGGAKADGGADDSAAVKAAIAAARANGGGIVFFPSGYYRLHGTFDVGAGVELRGSSGSRNAPASGTVGATDQLMSVILIEPNSGGHTGAPLFTLGDGSGVRGIIFFYPGQNWKQVLEGNVPFAQMPFTVSANGKGNYLINCCAPNPYQFVHFTGARDFLVEGCLLGGVGTVFRVSGGSQTGRIQACHVKPSGFWGGLTDMPNSAENRGRYGEKTVSRLVVFDLQDCSDITLAATFGRTAHRLVTVNGASGRAILIAGEQLQNGFVFERAGKEAFDLISSDTNLGLHGDNNGKHAILLDKDFHGTVHAFGGADGGDSDYVAKVLGGELITQERATPGYGYRSPRGVYVGKNGSLTVLGGGFGPEWTQTIEPWGKFQAKTGIQPLVSATGQLQFDEYGLVFDRTVTERHRDERSWSQQLISGDTFRVNVTAPTFTKAKAVTCDVTVGLYTDAECQVSLFYTSATGDKLARTVKASSDGFSFLHFSIRDACFSNSAGPHLRIVIDGPIARVHPRISYVKMAQK